MSAEFRRWASEMRTIENTLSLWVSGILTSAEVIAWAERQIIRLDAPPMELIDLMMSGPQACLKWAQSDFPPRARSLEYDEAFSVRALLLSLESDAAVLDFAVWAADACMGEVLTNPMVKLGYVLDHHINDCRDYDGAMALVRTELPKLLNTCKIIAEPFEDVAQ